MINNIISNINIEIEKFFLEENIKTTVIKACGKDLNNLSEKYFFQILEPLKILLQNGGKRWRPVLMILIDKMIDENSNILPLSLIVELAHNGTLIIDDIEDNAEQRRGIPCAHIKYGVDFAINSGNFIYFLPTALINNYNCPLGIKLKLYQTYTKFLTRVHIGQGLDILWHKDLNYIPTEKEYMEMCKLKTGSLAAMATNFAGICNFCTNQELLDLEEFAESLGIAFQIYDDIINLETGNVGKFCGDDIVEGKKSLPVIYYAEKNDPKKLFELIKKASLLGNTKGQKEVAEAINLIKNSDAIDRAKIKADELIKRAKEKILNFKKNIYQEEILKFIDSMF